MIILAFFSNSFNNMFTLMFSSIYLAREHDGCESECDLEFQLIIIDQFGSKIRIRYWILIFATQKYFHL